jgi:outer membrane usher protein
VGNANGLRVDRHGYAVIPYLTPYQLDTITLDPTGLPLDVQLEATSAQVAPRAGSVVLVKFKTESGRFVLIQATLEGGGTPPFGAEVVDGSGTPVGVVGQAGQIMARLPSRSGHLSLSWLDDDGDEQRCTLDYSLPEPSSRPAGDPRFVPIESTCSRPTASIKLPDATHG